jgi:hypothetical protein
MTSKGDIVARPSLQMQALSRAIARVGIKHSDPEANAASAGNSRDCAAANGRNRHERETERHR